MRIDQLLLLEHEADLGGRHAGAAPVVEVVLQIAVPDTELQLLQELAVKKNNGNSFPSDQWSRWVGSGTFWTRFRGKIRRF
jgi:hypothetical protein